MIYTGLPYDMQLMDDIEKNGAVVDLSKIDFPSIEKEKQSKTALIFLRNTGFDNIRLDMSKCTEVQKFDILDEYMTSGIKVKLKEFVDAWCEILLYDTQKIKLRKYFNDNEYGDFIKQERNIIDELESIIVSIPLFIMNKASFIDMGPIKKVTKKEVGENYVFLMDNEHIQDIMCSIQKEPVFYKDIFSDNNMEFFNTINTSKNLLLSSILYGMSMVDEDEWKSTMDTLFSKEGE